MMLRKIAAAVMVGAAALSGAAHAIPSLTNAEASYDPFGGFDWASPGSAWTVGFVPVAGSSFTIFYAGWATRVLDTSQNAFTTNDMDVNANGSTDAGKTYEYTIFGQITETVTGCLTIGPSTTCAFESTGGSFNIYYDTAPNANALQGTGFQDGVSLIAGTVSAGAAGNFTAGGTGGIGGATLFGSVTSTNAAFINPALASSTFGTTLQFGNNTTGWTQPTSFDANGDGIIQAGEGLAQSPSQVIMQADANQIFGIPEPTGLLLAGTALAGLGLFSRRRKNG